MDPDPDPGGPNTCGSGGSGSGFGSRSATLVLRRFSEFLGNFFHVIHLKFLLSTFLIVITSKRFWNTSPASSIIIVIISLANIINIK
jgi:hypothetical protein